MSGQLKNDTEERKLRVTLLSAGWKVSSNGDLTTINRELAIQMAKHPYVEVSVFLPQCSEEDKKDADGYNVKLIEAVKRPGLKPVFWLASVPDGHAMDCVLGHGVDLGQQIPLIKGNPNYSHCKWIQVVHTAPEEIGMYKSISEGQQMQQTEIELCKMADQVVTIGPKLTDAYKHQLRKQDIFNLTPSILSEFSDVQQASDEERTFCVLVTESGDSEDFYVKGYDVAAKAIAELKDKSYQLKFASKQRGKEDELANKLLQCGIGRNQLMICSFDENRETLANLFSAVDIAILPSKTEGFGLSALEAISAGLPVLVSSNSGIAEALRKVPIGSHCVVDSEDPAEWARAIKAVRYKERNVRLAEARILRENYLQQFSWEKPCNSLVEKMYSLAFGGEMNTKVDVDVLEPERQNMQTGMLATESVRCQEVQQPMASAILTASGSVSYSKKEHLKAFEKEIFLSIVQNYLQTTPPQSPEEHNRFKEYMKEMRLIISGTSLGSLVITVKCESLMILEDLWTDYSSGHLGEVVQNCFVTEKILKELNLAELRLKTIMDIEEYNACKMFFEKDALRDALSSEFHSTSSTSESPLTKEQWEKSEQKTKIMETAKLEDQKLNIKVDVEHVKRADQDAYNTASVLALEPAGYQKASTALGTKRKTESDADLEDLQPLKKKVLCLIAMNYLDTTPAQSRDEHNEFKEYLQEMKVFITGVSMKRLVKTVKCDSFSSLEELWDDYSCGLLDKMVRDCFVTEKILKELNLAELKLKTTMDTEEYNAYKLYFLEKDALRGASSSEFHSISSTSESPQNQEELKKWKQKTKIVETEKLKGTSPPSYMFTTGREKEQEELPKAMRLQERKEFSTRNNKISVSKSEITEEGGALMVQNVPSRVLIPPKALPTCTEVTCSLWNQQILSPPLGRNEALVSSVMELACGNLPGTEERYEFNVKVKVALSHSASDIKGYELVIKELTNENTNDWRDLKTRWAWTPSDIKDEHSGVDEFPDWLFPFAEAEITSFSSFAVVWRLKSFTFKNPSTMSSSCPCILSDHPGVSVTFPESSLPTGQTFALTAQVQEVPCSNAKLKEPLVVGPILHISTSEPVQLLAPARLTIPVTLREDIPKCLDYSATDVRIFCRTSEEDEREWNEVTEQLENIAVLENGTVTFTVNHFSSYWVWIDRLKLPFVTLKNAAYDFCRRLMLQEVGFFARLYATGNPTIYVLILYCFPLHLREQVQTPLSPDLRRLCAQGGGNSLKPLCKEDWMSVSLSEAFTLMQEVNLDNFLKFLGTDHFVRSLRVSISDLSNLQVELYMEKQSHRDKLCTLNFTLTLPDQTSSPRNLLSTAQVVMPEQEEDQVALEFSTAFPSPKALEETDSSISSEKVLNVTILADEWKSLKGGLSTFNRELAIHLASCSDTKLTVFVPHGACGEEEKAKAEKEKVSIIEAKELISSSPHEELFFPPEDLKIDVVIGHGVKLGRQAQNITLSKKCMWVQVVHTAPAELGMHKRYSNAVTQSGVKNKREVDLCKIADLVMAVGPKLKGFYSNQLRSFEKEQDVVEFTPGIMRELNGVELSPYENHEFQVLMFGRGDDEDFELKGYDIAAGAFASRELKNDSYHLTFVGAAQGKEGEFAKKILKHEMSKNQLSVEEYIKDRDRLKELLLRMDLVIMPSRTEGFGLTALEALSAGLPVLAGHNSGFSEALQEVEFGDLCVVKSDKPEDWSEAIKNVRQKKRKQRLKEMQRVRESYGQKYNWEEQCEFLVKEMRRKLFELQNIDNKPTKTP